VGGPRSPFSKWWIRAVAAQVGLTKVEMRDGRTQVGVPAREGRDGWTQVGLPAGEGRGGWTQVGVACGGNARWVDGGRDARVA
jgi:hypothetical protein